MIARGGMGVEPQREAISAGEPGPLHLVWQCQIHRPNDAETTPNRMSVQRGEPCRSISPAPRFYLRINSRTFIAIQL